MIALLASQTHEAAALMTVPATQEQQMAVILAVFAPFLGAFIVGFFGRPLGNIFSQTITTGLLFLS